MSFPWATSGFRRAFGFWIGGRSDQAPQKWKKGERFGPLFGRLPPGSCGDWWTKLLQPEPMKDWGLLLLRVSAGFGLAYGHGWAKITGLAQDGADYVLIGMVEGWGWPAPALFAWAAALAEGACGVLVAAGLWTRASALACGATMGIAFTYVHFGDPWDKDAGGEMAFLYLTVFLALAALGAIRFFQRRAAMS